LTIALTGAILRARERRAIMNALWKVTVTTADNGEVNQENFYFTNEQEANEFYEKNNNIDKFHKFAIITKIR